MEVLVKPKNLPVGLDEVVRNCAAKMISQVKVGAVFVMDAKTYWEMRQEPWTKEWLDQMFVIVYKGVWLQGNVAVVNPEEAHYEAAKKIAIDKPEIAGRD